MRGNRLSEDQPRRRRGERIAAVCALCLGVVVLLVVLFRLPQAAPTAAASAVKEKPFRLIAHRGCTARAPENTLPAFAAAAAEGYTCVETDLRFTSDGRPVLLHNPTVDATSNGQGSVAAYTFDALRALDFGGWYGVEYAGTPIPTLEEALSLCRILGLEMYLELKVPDMTEEQYRLVVDTVDAYGMREAVTFSSFYLTCLQGIADLDPGFAFVLITSAEGMGGAVLGEEGTTILNAVEYLQSLEGTARRTALSWDARYLTPALAEAVRSAGVELETWTVDDLDQLLALPVNCTAVVTNRLTRDAVIARYVPERMDAGNG